MPEPTVQVASAEAYGLAEGPLWDGARARLVWVDINAGNVHRGELDGGRVRAESHVHLAQTVGAAVVDDRERLLIAGARDVYLAATDAPPTRLATLIAPGIASRLNDGACDPAGRFLVGAMALDDRTGEECLYRLEHDGTVTVLDDDLTLSNGLGWSPDGATLYSVDTVPGVVWARPYDAVSGTWGERRPLLHVGDGSPDGLCVDTGGDIWIAIHGAGEVRRYTADGSLVQTLTVPAPHVTSVAFVGPALDRLLITTACDELAADERTRWPLSGHLFMARVDATGLTATPWAGPAR